MKEFWNERFSSEEYIYGTEPNLFFKSELDKRTPGDLLMPAEGEGRNAVYAVNLWVTRRNTLMESFARRLLNLRVKLPLRN